MDDEDVETPGHVDNKQEIRLDEEGAVMFSLITGRSCTSASEVASLPYWLFAAEVMHVFLFRVGISYSLRIRRMISAKCTSGGQCNSNGGDEGSSFWLARKQERV